MAKRFEKYGTLREWEWNNYNERGWTWKEEIGTGYEIKLKRKVFMTRILLAGKV